MTSLGQLKLIKSRAFRQRTINNLSIEVRQRLANLADIGRKKRIEEAAEFAQLSRDLKGEQLVPDTIEQAQAIWDEHTIGFTWRDEEHRYGEWRMFLVGFEAGKLFPEEVAPGNGD